MALPSSGTISMLQVNNELGKSSTQKISLNDTQVRSLANKTSGTISMSDLYGKIDGIVKIIRFESIPSGTYDGKGTTRATFKDSNNATILDIYGGTDISGYVCPVNGKKDHDVYVGMKNVTSVLLRQSIYPISSGGGTTGGSGVLTKIYFLINGNYTMVGSGNYAPSNSSYITRNLSVNYP